MAQIILTTDKSVFDAKKQQRIENARKRSGRSSNGVCTSLVRLGYRGFDFLSK